MQRVFEKIPYSLENIVYISDFEQCGKDAIQTAVDACSKMGGGTVIVPKGEWKSGAIHLKSNINLHLDDGTVVIFSDNPSDYLPVVFTRWEGMECYNYSPLIYANGCENISVTGNGTLIGSGQSWWHWKELQQSAAEELCYAEFNGILPEERIFGTETAALRPSFIQPINCKNVMLEVFTIKDGPQWTIHPVYCDNVTVRGVTVSTHGHNTDGLNPDSCRNVLIENCTFETGDDCIAINSGMNEDGQRVHKPCENIEIRNCQMTGGHGAVVIGSAMSGGVKNVYAHDCKISGTMQGIRLKSMRGRGGYVDNVKFENMEINDVTEQAIQINMFYVRSTSVKDYVKDNAKRYFNFNDSEAEEYADIQCEFLEAANSRRPDFMTQGVYSLTSYGDEGQIVLDKYDSLLKRSEALYNSLPADKQPSFYELQLYALKSADNVVHTFVNADKAALYKSQGRGASVNKYAEKSKSAWAKITDDMNEYNTI